MIEHTSKRPVSAVALSTYQANPSSVGLAGLVDLLTNVPLDINPGLRKVISLPMDLNEIINGRGEIFEIAYTIS